MAQTDVIIPTTMAGAQDRSTGKWYWEISESVDFSYQEDSDDPSRFSVRLRNLTVRNFVEQYTGMPYITMILAKDDPLLLMLMLKFTCQQAR